VDSTRIAQSRRHYSWDLLMNRRFPGQLGDRTYSIN
jgi:hypothetical protein